VGVEGGGGLRWWASGGVSWRGKVVGECGEGRWGVRWVCLAAWVGRGAGNQIGAKRGRQRQLCATLWGTGSWVGAAAGSANLGRAGSLGASCAPVTPLTLVRCPVAAWGLGVVRISRGSGLGRPTPPVAPWFALPGLGGGADHHGPLGTHPWQHGPRRARSEGPTTPQGPSLFAASCVALAYALPHAWVSRPSCDSIHVSTASACITAAALPQCQTCCVATSSYAAI